MPQVQTAPIAPELMQVTTAQNGGRRAQQPYDPRTGLYDVKPLWLERTGDGTPVLTPLKASGLDDAIAAARELSGASLRQITDPEDHGYAPRVREVAAPLAVIAGPGSARSAARLTQTPPTAMAAGHSQRIVDLTLRSWIQDRPDDVRSPSSLTSFELYGDGVAAVVAPHAQLPSSSAR